MLGIPPVVRETAPTARIITIEDPLVECITTDRLIVTIDKDRLPNQVIPGKPLVLIGHGTK